MVDDVVGVVDGGCVGVVGSDVAASRGVLGCSTRVCVAVSVVWGVAWVLKSTPAFFNVVSSSFSGGSFCRVAQRRSGAASVCTAVSMVIVVVWVLPSVVSVVVCFPFHRLRSSAIPPLCASSSLSSTSSPHCS